MTGSGSVIFIIKASIWVLALLLIGGGVVSFALAAEAGGGLMLWLGPGIAVFGPPLVCGPVYLLCRVVEALESQDAAASLTRSR